MQFDWSGSRLHGTLIQQDCSALQESGGLSELWQDIHARSLGASCESMHSGKAHEGPRWRNHQSHRLCSFCPSFRRLHVLPVRPHSGCCAAASPHPAMPGGMLFRLFHICQDPVIDPALLALLAAFTSTSHCQRYRGCIFQTRL